MSSENQNKVYNLLISKGIDSYNEYEFYKERINSQKEFKWNEYNTQDNELNDELFEKHPDTGTQFEGNSIPRWDELNALSEKVVRVVPEQKQVGWDFALSKNGWVMVEGNSSPGLQSLDLDHGLRPLVTSTFGKVIPIWH